MSDAIFATIRDGCVALDEPTDWPDGRRVAANKSLLYCALMP